MNEIEDQECLYSGCKELLSTEQVKRKSPYCSLKCGTLGNKKGIYGKCSFAKCHNLMYTKKSDIREQNFCSRSCLGSSGYKARKKKEYVPKPTKNIFVCSICGEQTSGSIHKKLDFCSRTCRAISDRNKLIVSWMDGNQSAVVSGNGGRLAFWFINWYKENVDYTCEYDGCNWRKFHPVDGRPGVQLDHIDGNPFNQDKTNLRCLCPEHHWATDTYGGRNISKNK